MKESWSFQEAARRWMQIMCRTGRSSVGRNIRELSSRELGLLNSLFLCEGGAKPGELKRRTGIGASGITNHLNTLEEKGLICRERSPEDRRSVIVHLSEEGTALVRLRQAEIENSAQELLRRLGRKDTEEFLRILETMIRIGEQLAEESAGGKPDGA